MLANTRGVSSIITSLIRAGHSTVSCPAELAGYRRLKARSLCDGKIQDSTPEGNGESKG